MIGPRTHFSPESGGQLPRIEEPTQGPDQGATQGHTKPGGAWCCACFRVVYVHTV
jgi:hypothetical protein